MTVRDETFEEFVQRVREEGRREGRQEAVRRIAALRLGRQLGQDEANTIDERIDRLGAERIENLILDSTTAELDAWLGRPNAV